MIKIRRKIPEAWYCGSLIQQNHGEANDKGILIWEIQDKENFSIRPFHFENPKPFISITLNEDASLPETDVPANARLRLVVESPITLKQLREAKEEAIWRYDPVSVVHIDKSSRVALSVQESIHYSQENLRDIEIQEELIYSHLKGRQLSDDVLERVLEINREVEKKVEYPDDVHRHVKWTINKFKWDNLFKYAEGNEIDFSKLNGLIGIFGKSYTGKSSVIDAILFTIFNSISKEAHKNVNFINDYKETANSEIQITAGNSIYNIKRELKKVKRKGKDEASGDVNFELWKQEENESLNGLTRPETDANIRKIFGTIDDFKLTSMIPQFDALSFVNTKSTGRKAVLAKYLDLEIFEAKFKIAKERADALKGAVKLSKDIDYDDKIQKAVKLKVEAEGKYLDFQNEMAEHVAEVDKQKEQVFKLKSQIKPEIENLLEESKYQVLVNQNLNEIREIEEEIEIAKTSKSLIHKKLAYTIEEVEKYASIEFMEDMRDVAIKLYNENEDIKFELEIELKQILENKELLCQVPCGEQFLDCMFIVKAHESQKDLEDVRSRLKKANFNYEFYKEKKGEIYQYISKRTDAVKYASKLRGELTALASKLDRLRLSLSETKQGLKEAQDLAKKSQENKEQIELRKTLKKEQEKLETLNKSFDTGRQYHLMNRIGVLEGEIEYLQREKAQFEDRMKEYQAYELYLKCMHSNGIAYDIIKQKLPIINAEIEKILDGIFDFTIRFEAEEKKLDIFICHPNQKPRVVTIGSGAEQTIAAIAITLALRMITTLPQSDIFILDEPVGALDGDLKIDFIKFLEYIKDQFKTVFLITHLDSLKDVVDKELTIEHIDEYARIKV